MGDGTEENGEPKIKCAALLDRIHPQDYISFSRYDMSPHGAGWSSSVARRAHNPKVVGSNPAPATKGKTSFKRMRFFLWREINLFEICEMCFARKRTTFGCCEMPAGVRRFISFHIAAKTQYITMHSTLVCEALFHILHQQNISLKTNRWRLPNSDRAGR